MCMGSSPQPVQAAPVAAPLPAVAPLASPEDTIKKANSTTGANRLATRRSLRIDLAPSDGAGLNVPS